MPFLFSFTDVPRLGDEWETDFDIDVAIHTRPALIEQRDRFARTYNTQFAAEELRTAMYNGLRDFGYEQFSGLDEVLYQRFSQLTLEAIGDTRVANDAIGAPVLSEASVEFRRCQREIYAETFDSEAIVARFVRDLACVLDALDPVERMRRIYGLRGARIGEDLPFFDHAADLLFEVFSSEKVIARYGTPLEPPDPAARRRYERLFEQSGDAAAAKEEVVRSHRDSSSARESLDTERLIYATLTDMFDTLNRCLVEDHEVVDDLIEDRVLPKLDERFVELDDELDTMWGKFLTISEDLDDDEIKEVYQQLRANCLANGRAQDEWLALAEELGSPVAEE